MKKKPGQMQQPQPPSQNGQLTTCPDCRGKSLVVHRRPDATTVTYCQDCGQERGERGR